VVHFTGRKVLLDEGTFECIHDQLLALVDIPGDPDVFLDFGNVEFLTSTTLGTLVRLQKELFARGRHLTVANLSSQVYEVFAVTRLDKYLDLRLANQNDQPAAREGSVPRLGPAGCLGLNE
jgi:anti-sigma B factor antagonist